LSRDRQSNTCFDFRFSTQPPFWLRCACVGSIASHLPWRCAVEASESVAITSLAQSTKRAPGRRRQRYGRGHGPRRGFTLDGLGSLGGPRGCQDPLDGSNILKICQGSEIGHCGRLGGPGGPGDPCKRWGAPAPHHLEGCVRLGLRISTVSQRRYPLQYGGIPKPSYDKITWGYKLSKHFLDDLGNSAPSPEEVGPKNEGRVWCVPEAVAAVDFPTGGCLVEEHATFRKG
jgi:hypothetical protein